MNNRPSHTEPASRGRSVAQLAQDIQAEERRRRELEQQREFDEQDKHTRIARLLGTLFADVATAVQVSAAAWNACSDQQLRVLNDETVGVLLVDGFVRSYCDFRLDPAPQRIVVTRITRRGKSENAYDLVLNAGDTLRIRTGRDLPAGEFVAEELGAWLVEVAAQRN